MFKKIMSYFWGLREPDLTLEDAYNVLNSATVCDVEEVDKEEKAAEWAYACYHKIGVITQVNGDKCIIDNTYEYEQSELELAIGMKVSFVAYSSDCKMKVSNVIVIDNEWNCSEGEEKRSWCNRCLVTKVVKREGRHVFVNPGNITIDLNSVRIEFIPIIGDWLDLDIKCELDEMVTDLFGRILDINKVSPLRPKIVEGVIKSWDRVRQNGLINQNIFFNREALYAGYIPKVGDKIIAEVIESKQGRCSWRALKMLPHNVTKDFPNFSSFQAEFENEHADIFVSEDLFINDVKLNDTKNFEFTIINKGICDVSLQNIKLENITTQCEVTCPDKFPILLKPKEINAVQGFYTITTSGQSRELLVFIFEGFSIGRWINICTKCQLQQDNVGRYNAKVNNSVTKPYNNSFKNKDVIKGQRSCMAPRFIHYRLPEYSVPERLWDVFSKYTDCYKDRYFFLEQLMTVKPVLRKSLAFQYYEDRFHALLHLEEISNIMAVRIYDREKVCFIRNGEFLMLEIENLSEQRPSIVCGDSFIASDPYSQSNVDLQGCVHKVGAKHVYLKFAPAFHDSYSGEDCSVRVVQSRAQMRRMHQAVGLAIRNLGRHFLFPTNVLAKSPQVNFTCEKYENLIDVECNKFIENLNDSEVEKSSVDKLSRFHSPAKLTNVEILNILRTRKSNKPRDRDVNSISAKGESKLLLTSKEINGTQTHVKHKTYSNVNLYQKNKLKLEWFDETLNYYQKEAVRNILLGEARPLPYFIFGPPGTGKTVTLIETILQLLRLIPHSRILVATPSNSAADLIALRLIDSGVLKPGDLVRFVAYRCVVENTIPAKLAPYCATCNVGKEGTCSQSTVITESGLALGCGSSILGRQRVIVGTCVTIGLLYSVGFPKGHFTHIIVDEAAQATEPEIMVPLSFLDISSGQVVLAGDPMQLGPVVNSKYAVELGLTEPFMERMLNHFPYIRDIEGFPSTSGYDPRLVTRLVYNYRSLPEILELPNSMFYFSELIPTKCATSSMEAKLLYGLREILPVRKSGVPPGFVFHGVNGEDYQTFDSPSWFNPHEASQIFYYVNELYRLKFTSKDIGVISPYIKQVKQIRSLLSEAEFDVPKVGTVEEFQGQEFNVILLSTVRSCLNLVDSDKKFNLGFVANPRRLNVALTRAKLLIIIIGNPHLLASDTFWRNVLEYAVKNGSYCGCELPLFLNSNAG